MVWMIVQEMPDWTSKYVVARRKSELGTDRNVQAQERSVLNVKISSWTRRQLNKQRELMTFRMTIVSG